MGLSYLVYPGAHHTRFHHALGSMHLMELAIGVLQDKSVPISDEEANGLLSAILLHDVGHGPFSHAMEHSIVDDIDHEDISLQFIQALEEETDLDLRLAMQIFNGTYHRKFMNQLVSSQLDMDRLDYLKRDSFYTGVAEGNINAERLITMLNVVQDELVVEEKGIYPVEKFLMARRFMYWQVYLHKTGIVAEQLLIKILQRAKELTAAGEQLPASQTLSYFLNNQIDREKFNSDILHRFAQLDDIDVLGAIKAWQQHSDFVLSELCRRILNRQLLNIKLRNEPIAEKKVAKQFDRFQSEHNLSDEETAYFVFSGQIENKAYNQEVQNINILRSNGKLTDAARASDQLSLKALSKTVTKYYLCYPKKSN